MKFNAVEMVTVFLVLCGAAFMLAAIIHGRKAREYVPRELQRKWYLLGIFMILFLTGYLLFIILLVSPFTIRTEVVTGPVFLGGAFFVYLVINLTNETLARIRRAEGELRSLNESLETRVAERTQELQKSHAFLATVLDTLKDGVVTINAETCRIESVNAQFLEVQGLSAEEVLGRTCYEAIHRREERCDPSEDVCPLAETVLKQQHTVVRHVHFDGNDEKRYVEVTTSPIFDSTGQVTQVVHVTRDITRQKIFERDLQAVTLQLLDSNEEMQQINEEMKNFTYIVSHDMRAPLVSIKGFATELGYAINDIRPLLEKAYCKLDTAEREELERVISQDIGEALEFINQSVNRMNAMIAGVLSLSRLGRREISPEPVDLTAMVTTVLNSLRHQIDSRGVKVALGPLPILVADKTSLEQIIGNLVDNALKYLDPVRRGEIDVSAEENNDTITVHVQDNGRGIAEQDSRKIFDMFQRVGTQDVAGDGMGLTYVKALVRRLGGHIWCTSEPGAGSTFSFTIPKHSEETNREQSDAELLLETGSRKKVGGNNA